MIVTNDKTYLLERVEQADTHTFGRFWFNGQAVWTLELPWKDNEKCVSCIPAGLYDVALIYSPKFKRMMWLVKDVPNRSGIRIHKVSFVRDLRGCIAPGLKRQDIDGDGLLDLKNSKDAIDLMKEHLPEKFKLEIIWNSSYVK